MSSTANSILNFDPTLTIELMKGGFVLHYPEMALDQIMIQKREVFTSSRKLNQKLKEVMDNFSTVAADKAD